MNNAKGEKFICEEDKEHTYTKISCGNNTELSTTYKERHLISNETDGVTGETAKYAYDKTEKVSSYEVKENNTTTYTALFTYNPEGRVQRINQGGKTGISYEYAYDEMYDGRLLSVKAGEERFYVNYDVLGRNTGRQVKYGSSARGVLTETISYKQAYTLVPTSSGSRYVYKQSILPSKISYLGGEYLDYTYDDNGNITGISKNGSNKIVYQYDTIGRLIYEHNPMLNKTYYYSYDNNGNIVSKEVVSNGESEYTDYTYNKDRLTNDGEGHRIMYDTLGNPTNWRGKELTWEKGKRLKKYGETTFEYDGRGRRTKKNTVRYYYDYADKLIASSDGMEYFYDHIGVAGFKKDGAWYVYKRDIQNNVTGILDSNGTEVVKYVYDAWDNHSVSGSNTDLGKINPFRYRSYFYDTETGLYFLKSRYYDPYIGRFLNMDSVDYAEPETINGLNLYTYCGNNPVMNVDPEGDSFTVFLVVALVGFSVSFATSALTQAMLNEGQVNWGTATVDGLFAAVSSVLWMIPGLGAVATGIINSGLTAINNTITIGMENNWQYSLQDGIVIFASSILSGITSSFTRKKFLASGGKKVLNDTHKLVGTIERRMVTGIYNNSGNVFSKSFRSAAGQMFKSIANLNFSEGFYRDWLITGMQAVFSTALLRGLSFI